MFVGWRKVDKGREAKSGLSKDQEKNTWSKNGRFFQCQKICQLPALGFHVGVW